MCILYITIQSILMYLKWFLKCIQTKVKKKEKQFKKKLYFWKRIKYKMCGWILFTFYVMGKLNIENKAWFNIDGHLKYYKKW